MSTAQAIDKPSKTSNIQSVMKRLMSIHWVMAISYLILFVTGIKQRYYPMLSFKTFASANRYCQAFDEVRNFFRSRSRMGEYPTGSKLRVSIYKTGTICYRSATTAKGFPSCLIINKGEGKLCDSKISSNWEARSDRFIMHDFSEMVLEELRLRVVLN